MQPFFCAGKVGNISQKSGRSPADGQKIVLGHVSHLIDILNFRYDVKVMRIERHPRSLRLSHRRLWLALYRRDVPAAERLIESALRAWPPQRIYLRLFEPALKLSGALWAKGRITHLDEHFVTYQVLRLMRTVRRHFVPPDSFGPLAIVTSAGQDSHIIGLRMVCDFLTWANWRVHFVSSPDRGVVTAVAARLKPQAVLLSLGREQSIVPAARLIADLRRRRFAGLVVIGGRIVTPGLVTSLGADLTASNGAALVRALRPLFPSMGRRRGADSSLAGG